MRNTEIIAAQLLFIVLGMAAVYSLVWPPASPPPMVAVTAPAGEFSAERARAHLEEITRAPRPVGSRYHAEVRDYLVKALAELGLEPEVQEAIGVRWWGDTLRVAPAANIMARLAGSDSTGAVVLVAHYDSVPVAPGAADAGNGVVAILETLRALQSGPPLKNDVIVLFSDAEEVGLLGAQAWVDEHPWAADTGIVLNAEGRGHTGAVWMFRTTANNGGMIRTLARAAPWPAAESLSNDIFRYMPNDTDLTVFAAAGYAGMDFANVHGLTHYHTPLDSFERTDPRVIQHHGSYLLSLARAFGAKDLSLLAEPDRSYFSLPGLGVVHYPLGWALPLAGLATLLVLVAAIGAARSSSIRLADLVAGVLCLATLLAVLAWLSQRAWNAYALLLPETGWFPSGVPYAMHRYLIAFGLLVAAAYVGAANGLRRWVGAAEMQLAALLAWAGLALASAWWLPGASYLFTWPLLFATLGFALCHPDAPRRAPTRAAILTLAGLPTVVFVVPLIDALAVALTLDSLGLPMGLLVLGLSLLTLQLDFLHRNVGAATVVVLAAVSVILLITALPNATINAQRPKPNSVHYLADLDVGEAVWYSSDPARDEWTRQFLGDAPRREPLPDWVHGPLARQDGPVWLNPAPLFALDGPRVELISEEATGEGRRLRMRIRVPAGSHSTVVGFPVEARIGGLAVDGRPAPEQDRGGPVQLFLFGFDEAGVELSFTTMDRSPLVLEMRSNVLGLPALDGEPPPPRPAHLMPAGPVGDLTRLQRRVEIP